MKNIEIVIAAAIVGVSAIVCTVIASRNGRYQYFDITQNSAKTKVFDRSTGRLYFRNGFSCDPDGTMLTPPRDNN